MTNNKPIPLIAMIRSLPAALLVCFSVFALGGCGLFGAKAPTDLDAAFAEYWEEYLRLNPVTATYVGDPRYNDQLPNDLSKEHRDRVLKWARSWRARMAAVDQSTLDEQDRLSVQVMLHELDEAIEGQRFPGWLQPINQFYSLPNQMAQLGSGTSAQPFKTVQDYENWLQRASGLPALFDQAIANMREGMRRGVVQPQVLIDDVVLQLDALITTDPEASLFFKPIENLPAEFSAADKTRLRAAYTALIEDTVMPTYVRLRDFLRDEYLPQARTTVGLNALPNGKAWYAHLVQNYTTTDLTPEAIHNIGLREVEQLQSEIRGLMKRTGFKGDLQAFFKYMQTSKRFQYKSEKALLAHYESLRERAQSGAAKLFAVQPRAGFEIRPVEPFRAKSAAAGSYMMPSADGNRPGIFYVNTYNLPSRKIWDAEDLFLHEAIPGHHFQLALQQELSGLPMFRRFAHFSAFIEGWALYAESLGKELGFYQDPYSYFGYLQNQLWRAIRLVVDTGLHYKGWTREEVIDYMLKNSAESETQATAEAERYMAIPGQALAYKVGELKIRGLRAEAEAALGAGFDIRDFHYEVLKSGALPLDILEAQIRQWIAEQRRRLS